MRLKFLIPCNIYVVGAMRESLELRTTLQSHDLTITFSIEGDPPLFAENVPVGMQHFRQGNHLAFTLEEMESSDTLQSLIESQDYKGIVSLLRSMANRFIRAIRNAGLVATLYEIRERDVEEDPQTTLRRWQVKVYPEEGQWKAILPEPEDLVTGLAALFLLRRPPAQETAQLNSVFWSEIVEAIHDDILPPPEREFTTNAIEHMRRGNFRMALLEAVIGLEIVLSGFIRSYLFVYKNVPEKRIKKFISKDFGLTARISGLLDLTLHPDDLRSFDVDKVLEAVNWRNVVTHKTGHVPKGISDDVLTDRILQVLLLTFFLAERRDLANAEPKLRAISQALYNAYRLSPTLTPLKNHRILADFHIFPFPDPFPSTERLNQIVQDLIRHLRERDQRFNAEVHLHVRFYQAPQRLRARWLRGVLEPVEGNAP